MFILFEFTHGAGLFLSESAGVPVGCCVFMQKGESTLIHSDKSSCFQPGPDFLRRVGSHHAVLKFPITLFDVQILTRMTKFDTKAKI